MNRRLRTLAVAATAMLALGGAPAMAAPAPDTTPTPAPAACCGHHRLTDIGARPAVIDVERDTLRNTNFRTARWTAGTLQLTLMRIPVKGDIGLEMHSDIDQFIRVEAGSATVMMGTDKHMTYVKKINSGDAILIPSGTWHNVVNTGKEPLKVYSIYGPAAHPFGTVHRTQADDPHSGEPKPTPAVDPATEVTPWTSDKGAVPLALDIQKGTLKNTNFRTAIWTADTLQLTVMAIPVKGDVGVEMHSDIAQFLRVEEGVGLVMFGKTKETMRPVGLVRPGQAVLVPAGTWHNVINVSGKAPLKMYSLYGPAAHPQGTVHPTKPAEDHLS